VRGVATASQVKAVRMKARAWSSRTLSTGLTHVTILDLIPEKSGVLFLTTQLIDRGARHKRKVMGSIQVAPFAILGPIRIYDMNEGQ
jgi:hypothetical protein